MKKRPCVLTIAGSDSGGGAGIQADLKTFASFGVHGASVIAAVTAQNSRSVTDVLTLPDSIVESQIDAVMSDLQPGVVKLGMLGNERMVRLVARKLRQWKPEFLVVDPVMVAASGARLLEEPGVAAVREELVPLATVLTPNWPEASALVDQEFSGIEEIERIAEAFGRLGARGVLVKGGHLPGPLVVDTLLDGDRCIEFRHLRIEGAEGHGTGCALASAMAAALALGKDLENAVQLATDFVHQALTNRYAVGASKPIYLAIPPEP